MHTQTHTHVENFRTHTGKQKGKGPGIK